MVASFALHSSTLGSRSMRCSFQSYQFSVSFYVVHRSNIGSDSSEVVERQQ